MKRNKPVDTSKECADCRTVAPGEAPVCDACGSNSFRARQQSKFPYDAMAAFLGVMAVIIFWVARS